MTNTFIQFVNDVPNLRGYMKCAQVLEDVQRVPQAFITSDILPGKYKQACFIYVDFVKLSYLIWFCSYLLAVPFQKKQFKFSRK